MTDRSCQLDPLSLLSAQITETLFEDHCVLVARIVPDRNCTVPFPPPACAQIKFQRTSAAANDCGEHVRHAVPTSRTLRKLKYPNGNLTAAETDWVSREDIHACAIGL